MPGNKEVYNRLAEKLENLRLAPPEISEPSGLKELFNNKTFMFPDQSKIKSVSFQFENEQCNAAFIFADGLQDTFRFGANKWISSVTNKPVNSLTNSANSGIAKMAPFKVTGAYGSPEKNSLDLMLRYIESPHTDFYLCRISGDSIRVETSNSRAQRKNVESFTGIISK
jgi:hypothetical protein